MLYQNFQMNPAISLILCLLVQAMAPLALAGDSYSEPQDEIERCLIMLKPGIEFLLNDLMRLVGHISIQFPIVNTSIILHGYWICIDLNSENASNVEN